MLKISWLNLLQRCNISILRALTRRHQVSELPPSLCWEIYLCPCICADPGLLPGSLHCCCSLPVPQNFGSNYFCTIQGAPAPRGRVAQLSHCLGALTPISEPPDSILCGWPRDWDHIITIIRKLTSGYYQSNPPKPVSIWFAVANESVNVLCPAVMDTRYGWHGDIIYQTHDWLRLFIQTVLVFCISR